ncbi:MAG: hypothetical protein WAL95_02185 [Candidatus Acidiferrales bacterium]
MKFSAARKFSTIVLLLAFLMILPGARADETNQATKVTFNQAVQIPGRVLPAGTYWFMLPQDITDHNQVRIYNSDRTVFYGTVITINAVRVQTTDKSAFTFTEHSSTQPQALVTWFYPGETIGHQFLYPKQVSTELAKAKQVTIVAGD